jgi:hypothetical protein
MGRGGNELRRELEEQRRTSTDGLGPNRKKGLFFSEFNFQCENNSRKTYKLFKGTKNTPKITKIPEKFPELDLSMNNPNKVFRAHEKNF